MNYKLGVKPHFSNSHGFFFVPPRAPCRAFRNHVMKSTASPANKKMLSELYKLQL